MYQILKKITDQGLTQIDGCYFFEFIFVLFLLPDTSFSMLFVISILVLLTALETQLLGNCYYDPHM